MTTAGVLLAAGKSRRFGDANKLLSTYKGRPLVVHAAEAMQSTGMDHMIAVVYDREVAAELDKFQHVWPRDEERSLSASIRTGISRAIEIGADRALIALGDMPGVTPNHLCLLANRCSDVMPSATLDGARTIVPACFPRSLFPLLLNLEGDTGARAFLENLPIEFLVPANAEELIDLDLPVDFCSQSGTGQGTQGSSDHLVK